MSVLVLVWYIMTELGSIVENIGALGAPVPPGSERPSPPWSPLWTALGTSWETRMTATTPHKFRFRKKPPIAHVLLTKLLNRLHRNAYSMNGVQEAAGSNPVTRTNLTKRKALGP